MQFILTLMPYLTLFRGWLVVALRWVWRQVCRPVLLPVWLLLIVAAFAYYQYRGYVQTIQNAFDYQDSLLDAQQHELYQLRGDTLQAHYELRQLYIKLNNREKQEVIYYEQLHLADDSELQRGLDSVFNQRANGPKLAAASLGQPAGSGQPGRYYPYDSAFIDNNRRRRAAGFARSLSGR